MNSENLKFDISRRLKYHQGDKLLDVLDTLAINKDQLHDFCQTMAIKPEGLYYDPKRYPSYYYYDFPVYFDIVDFRLDDKSAFYIESVKRRIDSCVTLFESGHWDRYFQMIQGACVKDILVRVFTQHGDNMTYAQLRRFYMSQFHGHVQASDNMMRHALSLRPNNYQPPLQTKQHTYKIYKGVGKYSQPIADNWFWTLDFMVAGQTAASCSDDPVIYEGYVKREHIIDYFHENGREEIVVAPEHVEGLKAMPQKETLAFSMEMNDQRMVDEFNFYRHTFIKPKQYASESDLHGSAHATRVLLFSLALAYLCDLDSRDRAILANAAVYHAIGRTEETSGCDIGQASLDQLHHYRYPLFVINCTDHTNEDVPYTTDNFSADETELIYHLIANHSKPSDEAVATDAVLALPETMRTRYRLLLAVLNDADALDGVRLGHVDPDAVAHPHTLSLITYAIRCLHILEVS